MALDTGQPIGDLLDVLGVDREWPELFDAICIVASEDAEAIAEAREEAARKARQERALAEAKRRYG